MAEWNSESAIKAREAFEKYLEEKKRVFSESTVGCGGRNGKKDLETGIFY